MRLAFAVEHQGIPNGFTTIPFARSRVSLRSGTTPTAVPGFEKRFSPSCRRATHIACV